MAIFHSLARCTFLSGQPRTLTLTRSWSPGSKNFFMWFWSNHDASFFHFLLRSLVALFLSLKMSRASISSISSTSAQCSPPDAAKPDHSCVKVLLSGFIVLSLLLLLVRDFAFLLLIPVGPIKSYSHLEIKRGITIWGSEIGLNVDISFEWWVAALYMRIPLLVAPHPRPLSAAVVWTLFQRPKSSIHYSGGGLPSHMWPVHYCQIPEIVYFQIVNPGHTLGVAQPAKDRELLH